MKRVLTVTLLGVLMAGCGSFPGDIPRSSTVPPPPLSGYLVRPEFPGSESLIVALRKRLTKTKYFALYTPLFGSDHEHDYVFVSAEWAIDRGFEGVFHSTLIFAKKKADPDWAMSRIWEGTTAHKRPFNGPIELLEQDREFGVLEPPKKRPNKAPEPTPMSVTPHAPSSMSRASHGRGSS